MANFMTRRFTLREKILLGVFLVILLVGLYFFLVHYPVQNRLEEIEQEREEVQMRTDVAEVRKRLYDEMQAELDEIFSLPEDELTYMPKYDNLQELMIRFNTIFAGAEPRLNFGAISRNDGIVARPISFSFEAENYQSAKQILTDLTGTGYRCLMSNLTLSPREGDIQSSALIVSGTITFYELDA